MYLYRLTNILLSFNEIKNESSTLIWTDILRAAALMKGCPYDNAVAEATFKIIMTEFANQKTFANLS